MELIKALMKCTVEKDQKDSTYLFVGSDETIDRDGEVIKVGGWNLSEFKKNPVILWAHNHYTPAIGVATKVYKKDGKLNFRVRFASEGIHELADVVRKLIDDGVIKAVSVGYIPKKREDGPEDGKGPRVVTTEAELYELSIVNVGANQNALLAGKELTDRERKLLAGEVEPVVKGEAPEGDEDPQEPREPDPDGLAEKVAQLETTVETLTAKVNKLSESMDTMRKAGKYDDLLAVPGEGQPAAQPKRGLPFKPARKQSITTLIRR